MKLDLVDDEGNGILEGTEEELSKVYAEGLAYIMIKGFHNMDDKEVLAACQKYAELHLKNPPPLEDVPDEWAYWTPGDLK